MATTFHLVRHAAHETVADVLAGRMEGVRLSAEGSAQAGRLGAFFARIRPAVVQSSPRERAIQTAEAIARACGRPLELALPLDEVDFGRWTGRRFSDLATDPQWTVWNAHRATAATPAGETMSDVQQRALHHLRTLDLTRRGPVVVVTHAEIIRAVLLHCLGMPLSDFASIAVDPASATTVEIGAHGSHVVRMNEAAAA